MSNDFLKQTEILFEKLIPGVEKELTFSKGIRINKDVDQVSLQRSSYTIWEPREYIGRVNDGTDATAALQPVTQLTAPLVVDTDKFAAFTMNMKELNDAMQEERIRKAQSKKIAASIDTHVANVLSLQSTLINKRTTSPTGYDDVAICDSIMNEQGLTNQTDRLLALTSRSYNSMASNLAARQTMNEKPTNAYERSLVGEVASFTTHKLDSGVSLAAATATSVTVNGANQYWEPVGMNTSGTGQPVDSRYMDLNVTVGGGAVAVGDAFTIADVYSVHPITKQSTGQLKTFRVVGLKNSGATLVISPAIISNGGGTVAGEMYQNVTATPANSAAITFLNTTATIVNPFWVRDSCVLTPGRLILPSNAGAQVLAATTDSGIQMMMTAEVNPTTGVVNYILRVFFGVTLIEPEMAGVMLFNQA